MLIKFNGVSGIGPYYIDPKIIKDTRSKDGNTLIALDVIGEFIGDIEVNESKTDVDNSRENEIRNPGSAT